MDDSSLFPDNIPGMHDDDDDVSILIKVECNILHQPDILPTRLPLEDIFVFRINVRDIVGIYQFCQEAQRLKLDFSVHNSPHFSRTFVVPFQNIPRNDKNRARHGIHMMLGKAGIPRAKRRPLLGKIYSEAMRLAKEPAGSDDDGEYKRIPVMVDLVRVYAKTFIDEIELEEEDDDECRPVPATGSAIEALEKVRVDEMEVCAVCLEEMEVESEASMMPCKHIFHGSCITAWLGKANLCPLCRFQLS